MAGAVMQPASPMQSMPEAGHGTPCSTLPIPGSLVEDIDMLSSADMLIAHGIIAVDANACDAPPTKTASANMSENTCRSVHGGRIASNYRVEVSLVNERPPFLCRETIARE
jgi:hypothetical protein